MRHAVINRLEVALSLLRSSERGIALPMTMLITVIAMGFAAVPIVASINSQNSDSRNQQGNEALAAAEAGAEIAVLRQSEQLSKEPTIPCVGNGTRNGEGWCPQKTGAIGEAEYRYQLRPCYVGTNTCTSAKTQTACTNTTEGKKPVQVISTGLAKAGTVSRRIELLACASETIEWKDGSPTITEKKIQRESLEKTLKEEQENGSGTETVPGETKTRTEEKESPAPNVYAKGQIVGVDWLNMGNNAQVYNGGAGSNGWVKMVGSANVCGSVSYGTTFTTDNSSSLNSPSNCPSGRKAGQGSSEYPNIVLPSNIGTTNSDSRLASADPVGSSVWQRGNISWNPSNRSLTVTYDQITLEGTAPYFLCQLILAGGSKLLAGSGKSIKIYFDSPENCPGLNGAAQLQIANGAYVGPDASNGPQFLFPGSSTDGLSKVELGGGANVSQFVVYAPRSTVIANNGVNLNGAIIGKTLELQGGAQINRSGAFVPPSTGEYLPPTKTTTTITENGTSTTTTSKTARQHEAEIKKISEEIEKLEKEHPRTEEKRVNALKQGRFSECAAVQTGSVVDSGC